MAAAIVAGETLAMGAWAGAAGAVTPDTWAKLRMCESSGNYATNTGNGYYGAYQFNLATWQGLGYTGLPSAAAPAVQDQAAQRLYASRGWQPWPACSAKLGLVDDRTASRNDARPPLTAPPATAPVSSPAPVTAPVAPPVAQPPKPAPTVTAPTTAPVSKPPAANSVPTVATFVAWDGHYLSVRDVSSVRSDVKMWQAQMVSAGYHLSVDGQYGPQSAAAATQFEVDHGLSVERPGVVGPQIWKTLFSK